MDGWKQFDRHRPLQVFAKFIGTFEFHGNGNEKVRE